MKTLNNYFKPDNHRWYQTIDNFPRGVDRELSNLFIR